MVRYGFWCFGVGFGGVGGQIFGAVSVHLGIGFAAGIGRRDGFGATTGREAISAQDIGFFGVAIGADVAITAFGVQGGVAGGVSGSEFFEVRSEGVIGGVSINAGSLRGGGVAGGVGISATAFVVAIGAAGDCFGVEGSVGIAVTAGFVSGVGTAVVVILTGSAFDGGVTISLAGFVCCCNTVLCSLARKSLSFSCCAGSNF